MSYITFWPSFRRILWKYFELKCKDWGHLKSIYTEDEPNTVHPLCRPHIYPSAQVSGNRRSSLQFEVGDFNRADHHLLWRYSLNHLKTSDGGEEKKNAATFERELDCHCLTAIRKEISKLKLILRSSFSLYNFFYRYLYNIGIQCVKKQFHDDPNTHVIHFSITEHRPNRS